MPLTAEEKDAIAGYTGSLYGPINGYLRFGEDADDGIRAAIDRLDSAIAKSSADEDLLVYRGVDEQYASELQDRDLVVGDSLVDAGFLSTSKRVDVARRFLGLLGGGLILKIHITKGRKALSVDPYSKYPAEEEILLPRDAELRVVGYDVDNDMLELEVV